MHRSSKSVLAAVAALMILVSACGSSSDAPSAGTAPDTRDASTTTVPATSEPTGSPTSSALPAPADPTQPSGIGLDSQRNVREAYFSHLQSDIEREWGTVPLLLSPGRWTTGQLGTELGFELGDPLMLWEDNPDYVELAPPGTDNAETRSLLAVMRPSWIVPPELAGDPDAAQARLGSATRAPEGVVEFEQWLAASPQVQVTESTETEISGQPAHRWALSVDPESGPTYSCVIGTACVSTWVPTSCECRRLQVPLAVSDQAITNVWMVEQPGADIVIVVRALESDAEFAALATQVVDSLELGQPQEQLVPAEAVLAVGFPNRAPDDPLTFPSVAGLTVDLGGRWFDVSSGILWIGSDLTGFDSYPSGADIHIYGPLFAPPEQAGRPATPFTEITDVVEYLQQNDRVGLVEAGSGTMLGRDARIYDLGDGEFLGLSDSSTGLGDIAIDGPQRLWLINGPAGPWAVFARPERITEADRLLRGSTLTG